MSTKSTVYYDAERDVHLYQDGFDLWNLYLDFPVERLGVRSEDTVVIPLALWKELRQHTAGVERYIDMPPGQLRKEAEEAVKERLTQYDAADDRHKLTAALAGCLAYGDIEEPYEQQVENYVRWYTPPRGEEESEP